MLLNLQIKNRLKASTPELTKIVERSLRKIVIEVVNAMIKKNNVAYSDCKASNILIELIKILSVDDSFNNEIKELYKTKERIDKDIIRVGVIGVTSAGKSTLINSLLGEELLPAEAKPSSSQLVSCKRGNERKAIVYFSDNRQKIFSGRNLTSSIISKYGNENENRHNKEKVAQIQIITPNLPLPYNVELIDSPGLDAYGLEGHEKITMETLIPSVDFCIFVTTCKTNSDDKMLSVLNSIARFSKPVIIIQNMVDSLKASPDGKKTVNQVAEDHINRIKRIVTKSDINNKSQVDIIQMSAIYALACRKIKFSGKRLTLDGELKWKQSGYEKLERSLSQIPVQVSSQLNYNRLVSIIKEIDRIEKQIDIEPSDLKTVSNFQNYRGQLKEIYDTVERDIKTLIQTIESEERKINDKLQRSDKPSLMSFINSITNNCSISETTAKSLIFELKSQDKIWVERVSDMIKKFGEKYASLCQSLNISPRDARYQFIPSQSSALRLHNKTVSKEVKQKGFWGGFKRIISFGTCGYETVTEQVYDGDKTVEQIKDFLRKTKSDYQRQLSEWYKTIKKSESYIEDAIIVREKQIEEAKKRNLNALKKQAITKALKELKSKIPVKRESINTTISAQTVNMRRISKNIHPLTYYAYIYAKNHIDSLYHKTFLSVFANKHACIYGWDENCTTLFLRKFAKLDDKSIGSQRGIVRKGTYTIDRSDKVYHPSDTVAVVFVNLTQPGAAKKQIAKLFSDKKITRIAEVVFVIQDLQEVINGGDLKGALKDMTNFFNSQLGINDYVWFSMHSNPAYNIALLEMQNVRLTTQRDEIELSYKLKNHLGDFYQPDSENIISEMMRSL